MLTSILMGLGLLLLFEGLGPLSCGRWPASSWLKRQWHG